MRLDYDPVYGLELLPQLNLSYVVEAWNFRLAGGRSIRSPDFTERFISTGLPGPLSPGRNLGNPNLVAEKSWSLEGGIDRRLPAGIQSRLTGFYRFGHDLIDYVFTNSDQIPANDNLIPSERYFYARNIGLLNTMGIEIEIYGEHRVGTKGWLIWGIAYQGLSTSSDSALVSKYLAAHSRNLINARLGAGTAGFRFHLTTLYKQRDASIAEQINQELEAEYMLWNLRMDKFLWDKRIMLSLQVNNLFNVDFADILGARMPGRWILGGLTWNFNRILK
jgi:iron complex outermembrane receptor protein